MAYGYQDPATGGATSTSISPGGGAGGLSPFSDFMKGNPDLAAGLGVGAAAAPLFLQKSNIPYKGQQEAIAGQAASDYSYNSNLQRTLQDPIVSGNLPPGAKAQIDQYLKQANNSVKQRYASLGLTGSTMEADQLAQVEQNQSVIAFQIAQQMFNAGLQAGNQALGDLKLESGIYNDLMKSQMQEDKALTDAIGGFSKAAGTALGFAVGGPPGAMVGGALGGAAGQVAASSISTNDAPVDY